MSPDVGQRIPPSRFPGFFPLIFRFIPADIRCGEVCHGRRWDRVIR